jgi:DNA-binding NarL/FixJ family response regulator
MGDRPERPLRILIADDHLPFRIGLRSELEGAGFEICAEAGNGPEAVAAALRERPGLCFIDAHMPHDGISAAEAIHRSLPGTRILMVTASPDEAGALAAARAGADGYLPKDVSPGRLPHIVRGVAAGEAAFPRRLLMPVLRAVRQECSET